MNGVRHEPIGSGMAFFHTTYRIVTGAIAQFMTHNAMQLAAAVAFYTIFSLAPMLVIVTAVAGFIWGEQAIEGEIVAQVQDTLGEEGAQLVQTVIRGASDVGQGIVAIVLGSIATIVGATVLFAQLKAALNVIFGVKRKPGKPVRNVLRDRVLAFLLVLIIGAMLILSIVAGSVVASVAGYAQESLPVPGWVLSAAQYLASLAIITLLFAIILKYLPDIEVRWRDVLVGAIVTAILFIIGETLMSRYLAFTSIGSSYGAAGALIIVLMWVYYSALIFLFGAEISQVYITRVGEGAVPSSRAVATDAMHPSPGD